MKLVILGLAAMTAAVPAAGQDAEPLHLMAPLQASSADYPRWALEHELGGRSVLALEVSPEGRVSKCEVVASSGYALLDQRACEVYRTRGQFNVGTGSDVRKARAPFLWMPEDGATNDPMHVFGRFALETGYRLGGPSDVPGGQARTCRAVDQRLSLCRLRTAGFEGWLRTGATGSASLLTGATDGRIRAVRLGFTVAAQQRAVDAVLRERLGEPCYAVSLAGPWGWRNGKAYVLLDSVEVSVFDAEGEPEIAALIEARCPPLSR